MRCRAWSQAPLQRLRFTQCIFSFNFRPCALKLPPPHGRVLTLLPIGADHAVHLGSE